MVPGFHAAPWPASSKGQQGQTLPKCQMGTWVYSISTPSIIPWMSHTKGLCWAMLGPEKTVEDTSTASCLCTPQNLLRCPWPCVGVI